MTDSDWEAGFIKCLGVRLAGDLIGDVDERGEPIKGDTLLLLLNAHHEAIPFALPATKDRTTLGAFARHHRSRWLTPIASASAATISQGRSLAVLRTRAVSEAEPAVTPDQVGIRGAKSGNCRKPPSTSHSLESYCLLVLVQLVFGKQESRSRRTSRSRKRGPRQV